MLCWFQQTKTDNKLDLAKEIVEKNTLLGNVCNVRDKKKGETPLHIACRMKNRSNFVKTVATWKAANFTDNDFYHPLAAAAHEGNLKACEKLIAAVGDKAVQPEHLDWSNTNATTVFTLRTYPVIDPIKGAKRNGKHDVAEFLEKVLKRYTAKVEADEAEYQAWKEAENKEYWAKEKAKWEEEAAKEKNDKGQPTVAPS